MSIDHSYLKYLDHFGNTVTVRELFETPDEPNVVALRHDVDYDLDLAMEMSFWEKERDIRSTYYLLHTADYWRDERFVDKCLQIQDFGHEIGLHLNVITEWLATQVSNINLHLKELLSPLLEAGVQVCGTSAHGDPNCYKKQFINYWCFKELEPSNPSVSETGLSAEGIAVKDEKFQIQYPESNRLIRSDGEVLDLWSVAMEDLGLIYNASHVSCDHYYTDSGGGWFRSDDPLKNNLKTGRHQILMHPIYWRGPQKIYFFLSTARSGSKWLTNFLEKATPLKARHEFSLNHRFKDNSLIEEKRTAEGFTTLVESKNEAKKLLMEACDWIDGFQEDYAEANVYLERFLPIVEEIFPDAMLIHLHRDPKDVVRSIINRDWYDTPEDNRHPIMELENWSSLNQFDKACWYVCKTNESLIHSCGNRLSFEKMVTDYSYLVEKLHSLGIPVFPRLAKLIYDTKVNINYNYEFPAYTGWSTVEKKMFHSICDKINMSLEYGHPDGIKPHTVEEGEQLSHHRKSWFGSLRQVVNNSINRFSREEALFGSVEIDFRSNNKKFYSSKGCRVNTDVSGIELCPKGGRNAHFLFGGGSWGKLSKKEGWKSEPGFYYRGVIDAEIEPDGHAQVFCLMYDESGELIAKRSLGRIRERMLPFQFSFKVRSYAKRFNLAIYMSAAGLPETIMLKRLSVEKLPLA